MRLDRFMELTLVYTILDCKSELMIYSEKYVVRFWVNHENHWYFDHTATNLYSNQCYHSTKISIIQLSYVHQICHNNLYGRVKLVEWFLNILVVSDNMCSIYAIIYRRVENQMKWTRELEYQTTTREKGGLVETMRPLSIYIYLAVFSWYKSHGFYYSY